MSVNLKIIKPIKFDWDKHNKEKNWKKHQVHFKEAEEVFFNKPLKTLTDVKHSQKENRLIALGITNKKRKLHIAFTIRKNKIRIISTRPQSHKERSYYEKN